MMHDRVGKAAAAIALAPVLALSFLLQKLGLRALGLLGAGLGNFLFFAGFRKKIVFDNLRLALGKELPPTEIDRLARKIFRHTGTLFLEILRNFSLDQEGVRRDFSL